MLLKITRSYDPNDFEVGKRHNLEEINIMNDDATINEVWRKICRNGSLRSRRKAMVAETWKNGDIW